MDGMGGGIHGEGEATWGNGGEVGMTGEGERGYEGHVLGGGRRKGDGR